MKKFACLIGGALLMLVGSTAAFASSHQAGDPSTTPPAKPAASTTVPGQEEFAKKLTAEAESQADLANKATDPSAILTQLGFFAWDGTSTSDIDQTDTALFQPVLPMTKSNVLRPALPYLRTVGPGGLETKGLGDLFLLDVFLFQLPHATWGVGPVASLPTATEPEFGSEKYELGPMAMFMWKGLKKDLVGVLGYNTTSIAGDSARADVNKFFFQPIWVRHFKWGYLGWTDQLSTIDWENSSQLSVATGLRFGKVWHGKTPLNMSIQPYYFINEGRDNVFGIKLGVTFIKGGWLNH
jgi:hypothetical protein